jgi:hypothetical protein
VDGDESNRRLVKKRFEMVARGSGEEKTVSCELARKAGHGKVRAGSVSVAGKVRDLGKLGRGPPAMEMVGPPTRHL